VFCRLSLPLSLVTDVNHAAVCYIYRMNVQYFQILCYSVPQSLLKSLVRTFFQELGMEIYHYHNVCCALTD
jgi:hypothetical protein